MKTNYPHNSAWLSLPDHCKSSCCSSKLFVPSPFSYFKPLTVPSAFYLKKNWLPTVYVSAGSPLTETIAIFSRSILIITITRDLHFVIYEVATKQDLFVNIHTENKKWVWWSHRVFLSCDGLEENSDHAKKSEKKGEQRQTINCSHYPPLPPWSFCSSEQD